MVDGIVIGNTTIHRQGISDTAIGAETGENAPLAIVHAADEDAANQGVADFLAACIVSPEKPANGKVIHAIIAGGPGGQGSRSA